MGRGGRTGHVLMGHCAHQNILAGVDQRGGFAPGRHQQVRTGSSVRHAGHLCVQVVPSHDGKLSRPITAQTRIDQFPAFGRIPQFRCHLPQENRWRADRVLHIHSVVLGPWHAARRSCWRRSRPSIPNRRPSPGQAESATKSRSVFLTPSARSSLLAVTLRCGAPSAPQKSVRTARAARPQCCPKRETIARSDRLVGGRRHIRRRHSSDSAGESGYALRKLLRRGIVQKISQPAVAVLLAGQVRQKKSACPALGSALALVAGKA